IRDFHVTGVQTCALPIYWEKLYRVRPEFKIVIADMQTFLTDLRLWLEQVELEIRSAPAGNRGEAEQEAVGEIGRAMVPCFDAMRSEERRVGKEWRSGGWA